MDLEQRVANLETQLATLVQINRMSQFQQDCEIPRASQQIVAQIEQLLLDVNAHLSQAIQNNSTEWTKATDVSIERARASVFHIQQKLRSL